MTESEKKVEKNNDEVLDKVADRLRFFFSNANLRSDRYMRNQIQNSVDNTITVENLLRFRTIQRITEDPALLIKAAETLVNDLVKVNDSKDAIGRKETFDFKMEMEKLQSLTLYVGNIPLRDGSSKYDCRVNDIIELFQPLCDSSTALVRLRFGKPWKAMTDEEKEERVEKFEAQKRPMMRNNPPLCSAFVEVENESLVKSILSEYGGEKPAKTLKLKENTLTIMSMKQWIEDKESKKKEDSKNNTKKRPRELQEKDSSNEQDSSKKTKDSVIPMDNIEVNIDWEKGCVISLKGLPDSCDRESILEAIEPSLPQEYKDSDAKHKRPYVDYSRGQTHGAVRFNKPYAALKTIAEELNNGTIQICDKKVESAKLISGTEEEEYWKAFIEFKKKRAHMIAMKEQEKKRHRKNYNRRGR